MRRAGIGRPRLAVAALNPHAGEGGLFASFLVVMVTVSILAARQVG